MPSQDPKQQKLRNSKKQWNSAYKNLSQKLKAFKDGLNGKGNRKLNIAPSKIKDPLPQEMGSILNQLSTEFQQLVGAAGAIVSEQAQYSQTRRKSAPKSKVIIPPGEEAPQKDIVQELSQRLAIYNADIEKIGSSRLSRSKQYLGALFSKDLLKQQRVGLLRKAADLFYACLDFENDVLSLSIDSVSNAISRYETMKYNFHILENATEALLETHKLRNKKPKQESEENKPANPFTSSTEEQTSGEPSYDRSKDYSLQRIKTDVWLIYKSELVPQETRQIRGMIKKLLETRNEQERQVLYHTIVGLYKMLVAKALANATQKYGHPINSLDDLLNVMKAKNAYQENIRIEKFARSPVMRRLKRWLVELAPFNKTASIRLEIVNIIDNMKKQLQELMNSLEKGIDIKGIMNTIQLLDVAIRNIHRPMLALSIYLKEQYIQQQRKKAPHKGKQIEPWEDPFISPILRRKVRQDFRQGLF